MSNHLLGITTTKSENFSEWYGQVISRGELLEYTDIKGCYVFRPWCYGIWENIQEFFNAEIKKLGVKNCYFPMFVTEDQLRSESDFIEGFDPEVAWVTKAGSKDLHKSIAVRPTSEAIMYPMFARWIRSHRDLPLKVNQWCNVVRWEFKHPVPFIRGREFLWQEGHSAFMTKEEAIEEVYQILDIYARVYEELLAVPVFKGIKSDQEKFAGGEYTTTCEVFVPANGRAIQAATSHHLGQNFAKAFNIQYEVGPKDKGYVYQNSWGLSTRSLGVLVMIHGDDNGLIIPPRVAPIQVILVPIFRKKNQEVVLAKAQEIVDQLAESGIRVEGDFRANYTPGWKYNHYELKGVPIRLEFGQRDMDNNQIVIKRRDMNEKITVSLDNLPNTINTALNDIHDSLYQKALEARNKSLVKVSNMEEFLENLHGNFISAPFCGTEECEENIKSESENSVVHEGDESFQLTGKAKSLCFPQDQSEFVEGTKCFACENQAKGICLFGRSY